jgi:integrase
VEKTTKTYTSTRTLTNVSPEIIDRILELAPDSGRVLPYKPNTITKSFIKLRNKHGFSFRLHDLRHYYASVMLALGIPDKYAMKQMGHATTHMLKTVYQHVMSEKEKEATDKIGNHMGELIRHGK